MEKLYTDASFSDQSRIGGMAVVAPEWSAIHGGGQWRSWWNIRVEPEPKRGVAVFCASFPCVDSMEAERRALVLAFLLSCDIIAVQESAGYPDVRVEIVTDSLANIERIRDWNTGGDPVLRNFCVLLSEGRIILSKVRGHAGNWGNELAGKWSKHIRRNVEQNIQRAPYLELRHILGEAPGIILPPRTEAPVNNKWSCPTSCCFPG